MGLDNGIRVEHTKREELPRFMRYPFKEDFGEDVEVCYWRKCYNLRGWFFEEYGYDRDMYRYYLDEEDINIFIGFIDHMLKHPKDWRDSIWTFKEFRPILYQQRWNLVLLRWWMHRHPEKYVYFYDSY